MILSRFWYALLAVLAATAVGFAFALTFLYNQREESHNATQLAADSQTVEWAFKIDSRRRLDALIPLAANPAIASHASEIVNASDANKASNHRRELKKALVTVSPAAKEANGGSYAPDVVIIVGRDAHVLGFERVLAEAGKGRLPAWFDTIEQNPDFELGGYFAVLDALGGFERDDLWQLGDHIFLVAARPIVVEGATQPIGAIVGLKAIDDDFVKALAKSTRTSIVFFARGKRVSAGTDGSRDPAELDEELATLAHNQDFKDKMRTEPRAIRPSVSATFVRLPGEASMAGFAVIRQSDYLSTPLEAQVRLPQNFKEHLPVPLLGAIVAITFLLGLALTYLEHTIPLRALRRQATELMQGDTDSLAPAKLRGVYREAADAINDGIERVLIKRGGMSSRPADLSAILGPVGGQNQMSAFALPGNEPASTPVSGGPGFAPGFGIPVSTSPSAPPPAPRHNASPSAPPPRKGPPPPPPRMRQPVDNEATAVGMAPPERARAPSTSQTTEEADWLRVYEEFLSMKRQCGEPVEGLTFTKFAATLRKNRDALMSRHACTAVRFTVYAKEGKAQLKASPVRDS